MERTAFEADRALIHTLIEKTPVAYIIMDDQYRIHYVNDSFLKLRRLDKEKTIGEICYNISNAGNHCTYCAVEQALETGKPALLQRKDVLPDGSVCDGTGDGGFSFFQEYKYKLEGLYDKFYTARGAEIAAARRQAAEAFYSSMLQEVSETQQKGAAMLRAYVE